MGKQTSRRLDLNFFLPALSFLRLSERPSEYDGRVVRYRSVLSRLSRQPGPQGSPFSQNSLLKNLGR